MITEQNTGRVSVNQWVTEASTAGFPPGCWPTKIKTTLGNAQPFVFVRCHADSTREYRQTGGTAKLLIVND